MDKKVTGIVSYIWWIGWLVAFLAGDKEGAKFHLNQSLIVMIAFAINGVLSFVLRLIPVVGVIISSVLGIFLFVCWLIGLINACKGVEKEIPIIGQFKILK